MKFFALALLICLAGCAAAPRVVKEATETAPAAVITDKPEHFVFMEKQAKSCAELGGLPIWTTNTSTGMWEVSNCAIPCNVELKTEAPSTF